MPQTFQVLRCFKCLVFQVHPTKKANKWKCKICGEQQSIKRFYGLGTGKECRLHVQKLNGIQGEIHNTKLEDSDESSNSQDETISDTTEQNETVPKVINKKSKWTDYVDTVEENNQQTLDKNINPNEIEVVLELPKKRPRNSKHVFNTPASLSSENQCIPSTTFLDNCTKDKILESKDCSKFNPSIVNCKFNPPAKTEISKKIDLLPTNLNSSKWVQYIEETEIPNSGNSVICDQSNLNDASNIFSLCGDDDNLDAVLDF